MDKHIEAVVETYGNMLFRVSLTLLANRYDAEDAVQETFYRYVAKAQTFNDDEHRKAWLIRVCINICKDMLRRRVRDVHLSLDDLTDYGISDSAIDVFDEIMSLPVIYREVVLMHYMEDYKVDEIAKILQITPSAVKKRLQYARERLRIQFDDSDK
ncbi:MAG: RNA polymerase sigma factor [Clostridia bacterium]|nr:RNA polymerase sigma factor [Clostridia bacterium]